MMQANGGSSQKMKDKSSSNGKSNNTRTDSLGLFALLDDSDIQEFLEEWLTEKELLTLGRVSRFFHFFANQEELVCDIKIAVRLSTFAYFVSGNPYARESV